MTRRWQEKYEFVEIFHLQVESSNDGSENFRLAPVTRCRVGFSNFISALSLGEVPASAGDHLAWIYGVISAHLFSAVALPHHRANLTALNTHRTQRSPLTAFNTQHSPLTALNGHRARFTQNKTIHRFLKEWLTQCKIESTKM